jgi:hypothetical protein
MRIRYLAIWHLLLTVGLVFIPCPVSHAQSRVAEDPFALLYLMTGEWVMTGTIGNQQVTHDVTVDWILKRQYIRIHEVSREQEANGEPAYEAWIHIAWDKENAEYVVLWLDNTGTTNFAAEGIGHGKPAGGRIPFVWRSEDGSGIHNTFTYNRASDTWSWAIDNVDQSGKPSQFARVTLNRK